VTDVGEAFGDIGVQDKFGLHANTADNGFDRIMG
jgi:hypothetical protein